MKRKHDEAVSPVIATILLVAIVVVLVAILAATVLPMAGTIETTKSVSVAVKLNGDGTLPIVTVIGGHDVDALTNLTVYVSGTDLPVILIDTKPVVGKPYSPEAGTTLSQKEKQTVNVVGKFTDGAVQTLYTTTMTFR